MKRREYKYKGDILYVKCSCCDGFKTIDCFHKNSQSKFGVQSICKECLNKYYKEKARENGKKYYRNNRENILKKKSEYWLKNKKKRQKYNSDYYNKNTEAIKKQVCEYRLNNREKINKKREEYYENNASKMKEYRKKYYLEHKGSLVGMMKIYKNKRTEELGFNWHTFHTKAIAFAKENNLTPNTCPICGRDKKIEMHHPSYDTFDKRSEVVFCCRGCHKKIHTGKVQCPTPINLLLI